MTTTRAKARHADAWQQAMKAVTSGAADREPLWSLSRRPSRACPLMGRLGTPSPGLSFNRDIFLNSPAWWEGVCDSHHAERVNGTYLQHLLRTVRVPMIQLQSNTGNSATHTVHRSGAASGNSRACNHACFGVYMFFAVCLSLCPVERVGFSRGGSQTCTSTPHAETRLLTERARALSEA